MGTSEIFIRKTIPQADRGTRLSNGTRNTHPTPETELYSLDSIKKGERLPGPQVQVTLPLTQPKEIISSYGTKQVIGGGTSKAALRNARRKLG